MKNNKGITLTSLVVTIIIILILAGAATYTGIEAISNSKYTQFVTELKIMQSHVNNWYDELKPSGSETFEGNIAKKFTANSVGAINANDNTQANAEKVQKAQTALNAVNVPSSSYGNYYLLENTQKSALGIEGVEQAVLVSVKDRRVVSYLGYTDKSGNIIYTIDNSGVYNVEYTNKNSNNPEINNVNGIQVVKLSNGQWKLTAKNVTYYGYTTFKKLRYKKQGDTEYQESLNNYCIVDSTGTYLINVEDSAGNVSQDVEVTIANE